MTQLTPSSPGPPPQEARARCRAGLSPGTGRALFLAALPLLVTTAALAASSEKRMLSLYDIPVTTIDGKAATLGEYTGKVLLVVNVASKCGFTGQYAGLEKLWDDLRDDGLVILGFPSNDFMGQEPGTDQEIKQFCSLRYNVTFPMFAKVKTKGDEQHPLYKFLTRAETNPKAAAEVSWNFNKFLIGRDGRGIAHFGSRATPESKELRDAIAQALAAK